MIVEVILYGQTLGTAEWNVSRGISTFQYSSNVINKIEPSPILMPTKERIFETTRNHVNFHNLPYLLSDSMPDDFGKIMMKEWMRLRGFSIEDINPVDKLTYIGKRGMGALEFVPANHKEDSEYSVDVSELLDIAKKVLEGKQEISYNNLDKDSLTNILRIGTSVGGARAKALLAIKRDANEKILDIRPGDIMQPQDYSYWLLKIDGANEKSLGESKGMGKIEYAYYKLAKEAGIEISESTLHEENGRFHFLTKRFDRSHEREKIHMQSFAALAGIDYRVPRASSYDTLFRVMKRLQLPHYQFEEQYRRMLFNVVARNHDDHVKNFSFMMNKNGQWKISPAYDICYSYSPGGTWTNVHQSSINGKFDNFTKKDLLDFGKTFGIKKAKIILEEVVSAVSQWPEIAAEIEIPRNRIQDIHKNLRLKNFS